MSLLFLLLLIPAPRVQDAPPAYFSPAHRIIGIGADRDDLSAEQLDLRAAHMIESQTFAIMREPEALPGARRITADPKLRALGGKDSPAIRKACRWAQAQLPGCRASE